MKRLLSIACMAMTTMGQSPAPADRVVARLAAGNMMPTVVSEVLPKTSLEAAVTTSTDVDVEVVVGTTGTVTHARIVNARPDRFALEQSVLDAARGWTFTAPVGRGGRPVATLAMIRMTIAPQSAIAPSAIRATLMSVPSPPSHAQLLAPLPTVVYTMATPGSERRG